MSKKPRRMAVRTLHRNPFRRFRFPERLERRLLLAADWQNPANPLDVEGDGFATPLDALVVVNHLNAFGSGPVSELQGSPPPYLDVNGDQFVSAADVLWIINTLNLGRRGPAIELELTRDTARQGTNDDRWTSDPSVTAGVVHTSPLASLRAGMDGQSEDQFRDVLADLNAGVLSLSRNKLESIAGSKLEDGDHTFHLWARNQEGEETRAELIFQLDTAGPSATANLDGTLREAPATLHLDFGEALDAGVVASDYFELRITSGARQGELLPFESVDDESGDGTLALRLEKPLANGDYRLTISDSVTDVAGNSVTGKQDFAFSVVDAVGVRSISPAHGEEMVNVTRETIVRFDGPVDRDRWNDAAISVTALGQAVSGNVRLSATNAFATFFYDKALPAATEVRVVVNGDMIFGDNGLAVDADGDGLPGGVATADFRTLPLQPIDGTHVYGYVRDSFTGQPLENVTIHVDALPGVTAHTDEQGRFDLVDVPAPEFFVHIDGTTAEAPIGYSYPIVGKPFHSVAGKSVQIEMDGQPFDIFLPVVAQSDFQLLDSQQSVDVGFGADAKARLAREFPGIDPILWDEMQVQFAPGAAINEAGQSATRATVVPVPPDRIPAPLPPGLDTPLVVSIQAPGATNFDTPAPVRFPNVQGLARGEQVMIQSFDHDAGKWVEVGTGTVSDDGKAIVSDPGVGIRAPGWHIWDLLARIGGHASRMIRCYAENSGELLESARASLNAVFEGTKAVITAKDLTTVGNIAPQLDVVNVLATLGQLALDGTADNVVRVAAQDVAVDGLRIAASKVGGNTSISRLVAVSASDLTRVGLTVNGLADALARDQEAMNNLTQALRDCLKGHPAEDDIASIAEEVTEDFNELERAPRLPDFPNRQDVEIAGDEVQKKPDVQDRNPARRDRGHRGTRDLEDWLGRVPRFPGPSLPGTPEVTVDFRTVADTAESTSDYDPTSGTLTFPPGVTQQSVTVPVSDDVLPEQVEALFLELQNPQGAVLINGGRARGTIVDDDNAQALPAFIVQDAVAVSSDTAQLVFRVRLAGASQQPVSLRFATRAGSAQADVHFHHVQGTLRFTPGENERIIVVPLLAGPMGGFHRTLQLDLFDPQGAALLDSAAQGTIVAESGTPVFFVEPDSVTENAAEGLEFRVHRTRADGPLAYFTEFLHPLLLRIERNVARLMDRLNGVQGFLDAAPGVHYTVREFGGGVVGGGLTNQDGNWAALVEPHRRFTVSYYDASSDLVWEGSVSSGRRGSERDFNHLILRKPADFLDGDRLGAIGERAVGTDPANHDTDGDKLDDWVEVQRGMDPLGERLLDLGPVATIPLPGEAREIVIHDGPGGARLAYIATGSDGLAIADVTEFASPVVLGSVALPGNVIDVAYDRQSGTAAVAGDAGLYLVDVRDPMQPQRINDIDIVASQIEMMPGAVYATAGGSLLSFDLATGLRSARLDAGAGQFTGMARQGATLYTMDDQRFLRSWSLAEHAPRMLDTIRLPHGAGTISVAGNTLFATAASHQRGGFATVDVSDASRLRLISGSDVERPDIAPGSDVVPQGSSFAVVVGSGNRQHVADTMDISDLTETFVFQRRDVLPAQNQNTFRASAVAVSSGLVYVADGNGGVQVLNVAAFDTQGQAPQVQVFSDSLDRDPTADGVQLQIGEPLAVVAVASDDTYVTHVEFVLDGNVVARDSSAPFDAFVTRDNLPPGRAGGVVEVVAYDSGGRSARSNPLPFTWVADTTAPALIHLSPTDGARLPTDFNEIELQFSEPLATAGLDPDAVRLVNEQGHVLERLEWFWRDGGRTIGFRYDDHIPAGRYRLVVEPSAFKDLAGNSWQGTEQLAEWELVTPTVSWIAGSGNWHDPTRWSTGSVPGPGDIVSLRSRDRARVVHGGGNTSVTEILGGGELLMVNGRLTVTGKADLQRMGLHGGRLVSGDWTVRDRMEWTAGVVNGTVNTAAGSKLILHGHENKFLEGLLDNRGTVEFLNGPFNNNGAVSEITNRAGAQFLIMADVELRRNTGSGAVPRFTNEGLLHRVRGEGVARFDAELVNHGTVQVDTGVLSLGRGGESFGDVLVSEDAALAFQGSTFSLKPDGMLGGNGTIGVFQGTLVQAGNVAVETRWRLSGGTLKLDTDTRISQLDVEPRSLVSGAGTAMVTESFTWTGGEISGTLINEATSNLTINASFIAALTGRLENRGRIAWRDGSLINHGTNAILENTASGVIEVHGDHEFSRNTGSGHHPTLSNDGIVRKVEGSGEFLLDAVFQGGGMLEVLSGAARLTRGGTTSGPWNVRSGAALVVDGRDTVRQAGSVIAGAGEFEMRSGTAVVDGSLAVTGSVAVSGGLLSLQQNTALAELAIHPGGRLGGTGVTTITGFMFWTGGKLLGQVNVDKDASLSIEGRNTKILAGRLHTAGSSRWLDGNIGNDGAASVWTNEATGILEIQADRNFRRNTGSNRQPEFRNEGTMTRTAGTGITRFSGPFQNSGSIHVDAGTIRWDQSLTNAGDIRLTAGSQLLFDRDLTMQNGALQLEGGTLAARSVHMEGGQIVGPGRIESDVTNVGGTLITGARTSRLAIDGDYVQHEIGSLVQFVFGGRPEIDYVPLVVSGVGRRDGTWRIVFHASAGLQAGQVIPLWDHAGADGAFREAIFENLPESLVAEPIYRDDQTLVTISEPAGEGESLWFRADRNWHDRVDQLFAGLDPEDGTFD